MSLLSWLLLSLMPHKVVHVSPPIWPEVFHATMVQNSTTTGALALTELFYEWPKGRNANLIHNQLGTTLYDIECASVQAEFIELIVITVGHLLACRPTHARCLFASGTPTGLASISIEMWGPARS